MVGWLAGWAWLGLAGPGWGWGWGWLKGVGICRLDDWFAGWLVGEFSGVGGDDCSLVIGDGDLSVVMVIGQWWFSVRGLDQMVSGSLFRDW